MNGENASTEINGAHEEGQMEVGVVIVITQRQSHSPHSAVCIWYEHVQQFENTH